jgi:2-polyprenyl-6-hydroxyphenyl methylase/3-demethylubiquinone-9 3-methyltransferase
MPADVTHYDTYADSWWTDTGPLSALGPLLNPARLDYFASTLRARQIDPHGLRLLDVGCGGGALAEAFAEMGCRVTAIDASARSVDVARRHAARRALRIGWAVAQSESLPFDDESFEVVYLGDVLEHVADFDAAIDEAARVLVPGGLCVYDTVNRTRRSRLVMINLFQEWAWSRFLPPGTHDWDAFITPRELHSNMSWHGLVNQEIVGLRPRRGLLVGAWLLRRRQRQRLSSGELGRRLTLVRSRHSDFVYMGHALKK